jgi:predicted chitinase
MSAIPNIFGKDGFFWWIGVVEDRDDPLKVGRCRVRILGYHLDNKEVLPTPELPWAMPMMPITSASLSGKGSSPVGPLEGTWVMGFFMDGKDKQQPMMLGSVGGLPSKSTGCGGGDGSQPRPESDPNVVKDGSGNVVTDGSGNPVKTTEVPATPPPKDQKVNDNLDLLIKACIKQGITDPRFLASIVANVLKECGGVAKSEYGYGNTKADRLRLLFSSRVSAYSDTELEALAKDNVAFYDVIYGYKSGKTGRDFLHTQPGDGWKYRGRGFIQFTGKGLYQKISKDLYGDERLVNNPDLLNQPQGASDATAWFFTRSSARNVAPRLTGVSYPGRTQADADLLATSIVSGGGDIRRKGEIGQQILSKVNGYSKSWEPGTAGGKRIAELLGAAGVTPSSAPSSNTNQPDPQTAPLDQPLNDPKLGNPPPFADPNSTYPKCDYQERPDTNKLATGDTSGTLVQAKAQKRQAGVPTANGSTTWAEPESAYCARYPFNHMIESESGHVIEMDDTPQRERIHLYHRTGTFVEIDQQGTFHQHVEGDHYGVFVRNNQIYIKGSYDITVDGASKILARNTLDLEVHGNTTVNIKNDAVVNVHGKADISVTNDLRARADNIYLEAANDVHVKAGANMYMQAETNVHVKGTAVYAQGSDAVNVKASTVSVEGTGLVNVKGGDVAIDGGNLDLNSGVASGASDATAATASTLSAPADRQESRTEALEPLVRAECSAEAEEQSVNDAGEDPEAQAKKSPEDLQAGQEKAAEGCKRSDLAKPAIITPLNYKRGEFSNFKEFPYTIQLSRLHKLGDVANVGSESASKNRDFWRNPNARHPSGLTHSELLDNLRGLCVNVLDPIKARYPGVVYTSCLRFDVPKGGSGKSQHLLGLAVDFQLGGVGNLYDAALWIRDNVAYDQLLLEYWNNKGRFTGWLHASFNPQGNRPASAITKVGTFMDHAPAKTADGKPKWYLCDLS